MDSLGRMRFSTRQIRLILWLLRKLNVPNVPSYYSFRKIQSMVRDTVNHFPTKNLFSQLGNHFTVTDPRNAIALVSLLHGFLTPGTYRGLLPV